MAILRIEPQFVPESNAFYYTSKDVNAFYRSQYTDTFGFYQRNFRVFSYMQMNSKRKYVVNQPKGSPLVWQQFKSCSYEGTSSLTIGRKELEPESIYMREDFCVDAMFDSAYSHLIQYGRDGDYGLDADGQRIFLELLQELLANAAAGYRMTAVAGRLYDVLNIPMNPENTVNISNLFRRTHGAFKGLLKLAMEAAQLEAPQLNVNILDESDFDAYGNYTGDIYAVLDELRARAKTPLRRLLDNGGAVTYLGKTMYPNILLSEGLYWAVIQKYQQESVTQATNRVRLVEREYGNVQGQTPQRVFFLDGRYPIIPFYDANGFDEYIKGRTQFAGIVASDLFQIGSSFDSLPEDIEGNDLGIIIARDNDYTSNSYGKYTVLSHNLVKTAIADTDYMVSTIAYTE